MKNPLFSLLLLLKFSVMKKWPFHKNFFKVNGQCHLVAWTVIKFLPWYLAGQMVLPNGISSSNAIAIQEIIKIGVKQIVIWLVTDYGWHINSLDHHTFLQVQYPSSLKLPVVQICKSGHGSQTVCCNTLVNSEGCHGMFCYLINETVNDLMWCSRVPQHTAGNH